MNNRVIVYVVNLGIQTTGKAHVSLQQCAATVVGEKIVFSQTVIVIINYRASKRAFSKVLFRTTPTVSFYLSISYSCFNNKKKSLSK